MSNQTADFAQNDALDPLIDELELQQWDPSWEEHLPADYNPCGSRFPVLLEPELNVDWE